MLDTLTFARIDIFGLAVIYISFLAMMAMFLFAGSLQPKSTLIINAE